MFVDTPHPWVCLQDQQQRLYGELIQVVEARQIAWLRPIILIELAEFDEQPFLATPHTWLDLRQGPDLLLPVGFVRPALDTEVLPLLPLLLQEQAPTDKTVETEQGRRQLNQLIHRLWQADPSCWQAHRPNFR